MGPTADVRLVAGRWDMHALQALAKRDHVTLRRVFVELSGKIPPRAVETVVEMFGYGAPMQFGTYGFFDRSASNPPSESIPLFDRAVRGDSLLQLALRHHDPESAVVLIQAGGSLDHANVVGETALDMAYAAFSLFKLRERGGSLLPPGMDDRVATRILSFSSEYAALLQVLNERLLAHHAAKTRSAKDSLTRLYSEFAPERIAKADALMREFEFREEELLASVRSKYGA